MELKFTARISVPPDVLMRELDGEAVVLNLNSERYFSLDEVGTRIWTLLTTSESIQAAYDGLMAEFDVDPERLRQDISDLIGELVEDGLVEVCN